MTYLQPARFAVAGSRLGHWRWQLGRRRDREEGERRLKYFNEVTESRSLVRGEMIEDVTQTS
jgi:hypothetical protein